MNHAAAAVPVSMNAPITDASTTWARAHLVNHLSIAFLPVEDDAGIPASREERDRHVCTAYVARASEPRMHARRQGDEDPVAPCLCAVCGVWSRSMPTTVALKLDALEPQRAKNTLSGLTSAYALTAHSGQQRPYVCGTAGIARRSRRGHVCTAPDAAGTRSGFPAGT